MDSPSQELHHRPSSQRPRHPALLCPQSPGDSQISSASPPSFELQSFTPRAAPAALATTAPTAAVVPPGTAPEPTDATPASDDRPRPSTPPTADGLSQANTMSRAPLLIRSSPAQGTGSYGGLPVHLAPDGEDNTDSENSFEAGGHGTFSRRKGKSPLNQSEGSLYLSVSNNSGLKKSKSRDARSSSAQNGSTGGESVRKAADETVEGQQESGLEDRFTTGISTATAPVSIAIGSSASDHSSSSSQPSTYDDSEEEVLDKTDSKLNDPPDNSPYQQVRASVSATDDLSLSINTPRMWTLSILFAIFGSSTNLFFSLRYPSVSITPIIALLLAHPLGLLWDQLLSRDDDPAQTWVNGYLQPMTEYSNTNTYNSYSARDGRNGSPVESRGPSFPPKSQSLLRRLRLWLAQGRWNEKEHCCVFISSNVSFGFAFATDVIVEQTMFYHQELGVLYQILLTISTQVLGYALAGITRRFLVRPSGMIWPGTLVSTAMFSSLHKNENKPADGWKISRSKFFLFVFAGSVAFYLLPGLLFPALSYFNVVTWFAPKNVVVANLFGVASGLGLFPMTFDWAQVAYIGSPLVVPLWAAMNIIGGLVLVMWIAAPIMYYANVMYSSYMPILSSAVFDNTGKPYDVSRILTKDFVFDSDAYDQYSRVFLPITYVLSYALQFAALAALITHTACWHGRDIWRQWNSSVVEIRNQGKTAYQPVAGEDDDGANLQRTSTLRSRMSTEDSAPPLENLMGTEDVHNRLMRRYNDVPMTWYLLTGLSMTAVGIFVVEYFPIHLPWYGLLLALGICTVLFIPIGIVMAITNQQSSLYLICQLICGVVFPGRPVANMVFVTYGYITSTQGLKFSSDLKLGHYMKIPPRILFTLQLTATLVSSLTQIGVLNWMLARIPGICTPQAINGFTCPLARVHFNGSILWGVVGPARFFGPGALYRPLVWAFLLGALAPIGVWLLGRNKKKSFWHLVNLPVLFGSLSWIPPATGLNFSVWALVCWVFNGWLRKSRKGWWRKYTMTLSAALDSGLAVGVVVVFFGVVYPGWMDGFRWWGTEVYKEGCDWQACPYKSLEPGQHFGPSAW
ncbi:OPT-domain-containing protein [Aulographum hederae CBS 113979]|uniref:OPT-domain-containing protein n=1 Tax=Aulographum hederae CBS 113979 TaxID=1176131 RepID=A0A6G1GNB8_9PEZI|nr:OPT-domain-containing protein [Aulographum hederae CBS 113979]